MYGAVRKFCPLLFCRTLFVGKHMCVFFFCQKTVLPVFNVTHFDWVMANFQKCSDAQLIMGCFAFQQSLQAGVFLPFLHPPTPPPTVHSNSKPNMASWINDWELITLAGANKMPVL